MLRLGRTLRPPRAAGATVVTLVALGSIRAVRADDDVAAAEGVAAAPAPARRDPSLPSRADQIAELASGKTFDVLVVGGGATGAGCALDARTRGLDVALIERGDFGNETSSRSTKLIWAGIRYIATASEWGVVRVRVVVRRSLLPSANTSLAVLCPRQSPASSA